MKTDSLFYRLFQAYPATLFELLGQPSEIANFYEFSSVEVKQLAFRIDGVFASNSSALPTHFVEVQFQPDTQFYNRTITEIFLYLSQNASDRPWRYVVLFAKRSIAPQLPEAYQILAPSIQVLFLDELQNIETQPLGVKIVDLVACKPKETQVKAKVESLLLEARSLEDFSLQTTMLDLIETILVYKFDKLSRKEIEVMFGLSELKQTRVYQEAKEEGIQEGRQEGLHEGIQIGKQNQARLLIRLLSRRFGILNQTLQSIVTALSVEQMEELGEILLDFTEIADLETWLGNR